MEAGTKTDLASIPSLLMILFPKIWEPRDIAAAFHDEGYGRAGTPQEVPRKECDVLMLEIMVALRQRIIRAFLIYYGLRAFGWWAFWMAARRNRKALS